jgi:hypothetical protein
MLPDGPEVASGKFQTKAETRKAEMLKSGLPQEGAKGPARPAATKGLSLN